MFYVSPLDFSFRYVLSTQLCPCVSSAVSDGSVDVEPQKRRRLSVLPRQSGPIEEVGEEAVCYRVVLETLPIKKSVLVQHLEDLWFNCGAEYQFIHLTPNYLDMSLIRYPPRTHNGCELFSLSLTRPSQEGIPSLITINIQILFSSYFFQPERNN